MEWLVIIGLVVAVAKLWGRVGALERRLRDRQASELPPEPLVRTAPVTPAERKKPMQWRSC